MAGPSPDAVEPARFLGPKHDDRLERSDCPTQPEDSLPKTVPTWDNPGNLRILGGWCGKTDQKGLPII